MKCDQRVSEALVVIPSGVRLHRLRFDEFVDRGEHCLLVVPSARAPCTYNSLLNPEHPEFKALTGHALDSAAAAQRRDTIHAQ